MLLKFKDRRLIKDYIIITLTEKKNVKKRAFKKMMNGGKMLTKI